jgi:hypothetical protein
MRPSRVVGIAVTAACALAVGGALASLRKEHARHRPPPLSGANAIELRVPHAQGSIVLDGDTDDPGWQGDVARTGPFVTSAGDGETAARPHTESKIAWGDGYLYVELYAADQDIRASHEVADGPVWESDSFHLVFDDGESEYSFDLTPLGTLTDGKRPAAVPTPGAPRPFDYRWNSGAHVSHELDGTPNAPGDEDEEWVLELAIPFDAIGLRGERGERIGLAMHRCDTLKSGARACGAWGEGARRGVIVLE